MSEDNRYTIAVDFDGVIHSYRTPWMGHGVIPDIPVPGAIEWLNEISKSFRVVFHTTRGSCGVGKAAVMMWLRRHGYTATGAITVTNEKIPAIVYIDDRGYRFTGRNFPDAQQIHKMRPWNKPKKKEVTVATTK